MESLFEAYKKLKEVNQTTGDSSMPKSGPEQVCPKCGEKKCGCSVEEELKGGQVKLDKNKNGKLDKKDFELLRKEDTTPPFDGPYTTTFKKAKNPNRTGMDAARALSRKFLQKSKQTPIIQGHEKFTSTPDNLKPEHFGKQVKHVKEEVLDEANHRDFASAGMMHPDMAKHMEVGSHMDYYEPKTGDKVHGKVMKNDGKEVHVKQTHDSYDPKKVGSVHKFKIGSQLPEVKEEVEQVQEVLTVASGVSKWIHDFVHSTNPKFKGKSVKERQKMALGAFYAAKKGVKEDYSWIYDGEQLDEISKATIGSYVKKAADDAAITRKIATDFEHRAKTSRKQSMKDANTNIANDYKDKSWKRQDNIKKAVDRLTKEEVEQVEESTNKVAPTVHTANYSWGKMKTIHQGHDFNIPLHPEHHEAIAKLEDQQEHHFKTEDGKHWTAKRVGSDVHFQGANGGNSTTVSHASMKEETMKSFRDFITEMEFVNGRYVHKGKYGTSYDDPEGKEDDEKPAAEKAEKRGRGRPAGSKSGARQIGGASKKGSGVEYTGYKLHLPNSNKSY